MPNVAGGGGERLINCRWYGLRLSPWECVEKQLFFCDFHLWGCQGCEEGAGLARRGKKFYCAKLGFETDTGFCDAARAESKRRSIAWPEGMGWLQVCFECGGGAGVIIDLPRIGAQAGKPAPPAKKRKPLPAFLKDATPAVRRSYLEGR